MQPASFVSVLWPAGISTGQLRGLASLTEAGGHGDGPESPLNGLGETPDSPQGNA
jgi:hypothetical protein